MIVRLGVLCLALWAAPVSAQPLTLAEVLRSAATHSPEIVAAMAAERQAEGRALAAEGAFDRVFQVEGRSRLTGFYDGTVVEAKATGPLTTNGGDVHTGYRVSRGDFPIYEDLAFTNWLGELKVGVLFSLLRDRLIDIRRSGLTVATLGIELAQFEREAVTIGVQRRAIAAYLNWVVAGQRLAAYQGLLGLANTRRQNLSRLVELGAQARILLTENDQAIVRRRALVASSEQDLAQAANRLSLFLRGDGGDPVTPGRDRLPDRLPPLRAAVDAALPQERPELLAADVRVDQAMTRPALARNDLKPRLDVLGEVGRDFGSVGLGGRSREGLETVVGVRLSVPLAQRDARGRIDQAEAEIDGLRQQQCLSRDQIAVEVRNLDLAVRTASELTELAGQEAALAERLRAAEQRLFDLGRSDFFLLNQREVAAAEARIRTFDAQFGALSASADLSAATVDFEDVGLEREVAPTDPDLFEGPISRE